MSGSRKEMNSLREWRFLIFETLFAAQMTGIYKNNGRLRVNLSFAEKCQFRSKTPFSQSFRNPFRSCGMNVTVLRSGTRVPKSLSQLRNTLQNGTFVAKSGFTASQSFRSCEMGALMLRSGTRVPNSPSQLRKFSQRIPKCYGMVWQQNALFAEVFFRLRNFAEPCFYSTFTLFLLRFCSDFFSFNFFAISSTWDHLKRLKHI